MEEQKIHWKPQPRQEEALKRIEDEILYGGARGGGKTDAGQAWLLYDIDKSDYKALVIRRNSTDLQDWIDRAQKMYIPCGGVYKNGEFVFPSGAKIRLGHLKDENAYSKYQGHEYHKILIEELTHIPREKDYEKLRASCRSSNKEIKPQIFATTNPDGPGYEWVKKRWGIPDRPTEVVISTDPNTGLTRVFIPAKLSDNPKLEEADPKYRKQLENLTDPELKRAWLDGSWEGFGVEGSYYRDYVIQTDREGRVVEGLYDPVLPVYTWCDLGIRDSFSIGYFQVSMNKWRCIDYDEFEGESLGEAINRMKQKGYMYAEHYAPHDIQVRELGSGKSRIEIARDNGIDYIVVPNLSIQDGINALKMRFPQLWFDKDKTESLRNKLLKYRKEFDEKRGIFKDKPFHDENSHGADMMRYWAITQVYTVDRELEQRILNNRATPRKLR